MFALSARFVEQRQEDENSDPGDEYATRAEALIAQHSEFVCFLDCLSFFLFLRQGLFSDHLTVTNTTIRTKQYQLLLGTAHDGLSRNRDRRVS